MTFFRGVNRCSLSAIACHPGRIGQQGTTVNRRRGPSRDPLVRTFGSSSSGLRDVLAKYHRPTFVPSTPSSSPDDMFVTSSTEVAGTSFQSVPPPDAGHDGSHEEKPLPAMLPAQGSDPTAALSSNIAAETQVNGPRKKEMMVQGVAVPPKPVPPGEEDCCMSGCVHCVYTIYADDLETYTDSIASARQALVTARIPEVQWPEEIRTTENGHKGVKVAEAVPADPVMAAFLALEAKMKKAHSPAKGGAQ